MLCGLRIVAESLYVKADGEALLWARKIDQRRAYYAVEHGKGMVQRRRVSRKTVHHLLHLMIGGEERSLAPNNVDIAAEASRGIVGSYVEILAEVVELLCIERPRIALGSEDGRSGGVERAQSMHQRRMLFNFREMVEIVRVFAQIDETAIAGGIGGVRPGNDEHEIV